MTKKCGYVAVLGETNAGKSTLINKMVGSKVSIVSRKIQTTLTRILGITVHNDAQIIFIDTPGFVRGKAIVNLEKAAWDAFRESDDILFLVDVCKKSFANSIRLLQKIDAEKKVSLVLNKIDLIHKPKLLEIAAIFNNVREYKNIFMVSSVTGNGVDKILDYLESVVPEGDWVFNDDETTDLSFEKYVAEITREHIYHRLHKEIPYRCKIETIEYERKKDGSIRIVQDIHVINRAHKVIVVGENGGKIKAISEAARTELSELLGCEVHLFLHAVIDKKG